MFNTNTYRALMRVMQTFGIQQYDYTLNMFYKKCNGHICAQVVDEPDLKCNLDSCINIKLYTDNIIFKYNKFAALESGKLVNINCEASCKFSVSEFIHTYSRIIEEIFDSSVYEFQSPINFEYEYDPKTPMVISMKDLK